MRQNNNQKSGKRSKIVQISIFVVLIFLTSVFALSQKFKTKIIEKDIQINNFTIETGFVTEYKPEPTTEPTKTFVPLPLEEDGIEDDPNYKFVIPEPTEFTFTDPPPIDWNGTENDIFAYVSVHEKPKMSNKAKNKLSNYIINNYPPLAMRSGVSGIVILDFICSQDGSPTNIRIIKENPKDMGFGKIAIDALNQVKFTPGIQSDKPVAVKMQLPIKFSTK